MLMVGRGHEAEVTDLAISCNNELVASSSNDSTIRVWSLKVEACCTSWPILLPDPYVKLLW